MPATGWAQQRIALVLGNSDYELVDFLPNAAKDARDMSSALRDIGFEVFEGIDLTRTETLLLVREMRDRLSPDDTALFYFSGHGIQIGAENFVLPVDAFGRTEDEIKDNSVSLQTVLFEMQQRANRTIIILDACRNNPFEANIAGRNIGEASRGLARVDAGVGSYIAFSTQPGNIASDGAGDNSPFTGALLKEIKSQGKDIHEVMRTVRASVVEETNGRQIPWENSSLIEQVFLTKANRATVTEAVQAAAPSTVFTHQVAGLDPNGDGFLALRGANTASSRLLLKMTEGTKLQVIQQNGVWFNVRLENGLEGWAHSNWIRFVGAQSQPGTNQCDALWFARNSIFDRNGYCFQGARGRATFSNEGCLQGVPAGQISLSASERQEVERLAALEKQLGC